ncbi:MAG TPA: alpha/beta fold hydrolase [Planctomycetota bacterium]|nr:alpha/beta fold hydrolase [Planctomycetota bacterium]
MKLLLAHGMFRSPASLVLLRVRLARAGHEPVSFGYSVAFESFERIVARFVELASSIEGPWAIVGHSLGGVIARAATPLLPQGLEKVVMLGTPNRSPELARRFSGLPLFRLAGDAGRKLADDAFFSELPRPRVPTLVVAGTGGPRWGPLGDRPSDGVVAVEETRLEGALHREVPCLHTFIMNSPEVARIATDFIGPASR